ncbi:hypothetical protein [Cellvibrio polysaccharolyticus]|uniref:hypothetical protein n=1 Tax=Cellvibrio polysaccharolyticus TaxID=2082724 RepID=UPI001880C8D1|nr:hypothetical protein [Cellvibrio polysaccharolyticus]
MNVLEIFLAISGRIQGLFIISLLAALLYIGFLIYSFHKGSISKKRLTLGAGIATLSLFLYISDNLIVHTILNKTKHITKDPSTKIWVDGKKTDIHQKLSVAFENRTSLKNSGSRPTKYISILLENPDLSIEYKLGLDSRDKELYWVYAPRLKRGGRLCYIKISL